MGNSKVAKRAVVVTIAATMALGGAPVWAETTGGTGTAQGSTATAKSSFPDVAVSHWANKHITKLSLLGIIQGYDGKFFPENNVSQQDALIMAIRMMGLEDKAKGNSVETVLPKNMVVRSDAKPYVIQAIESGLIKIQEESDSAGSGDKTSWGERGASREWIAKIVVRMLGKQGEADKQQNGSTSFSDTSSMSSWAIGYINAAVGMKLVDGFEDGSFKPKGSVTRAQMATFLSRAAKDIAQLSGQASIRYIDQIGDKSIRLADSVGTLSSFGVSGATAIFNASNDPGQIKFSDLKAGSEIYVVTQGTNAVYIEVVREDAGIEMAEGVLEEVNLVEMKLKLTAATGTGWYDLAQAVTVLNKDGSGSSLGSLEKGSKLALKRLSYPAGSKFSQVTIVQPPVIANAEGAVQSVKASENKLIVAEKDKGTVEYTLAAGADITFKGTTSTELGKLQQGDKVKYQTLNGAITTLDVTKPYAETVDQGKLEYVSSDAGNSYVTIRKAAGNKPASYDVRSDVTVTIPGLSYAGVKDLKVGDELKVELDDNNNVTAIIVMSRSIRTTYMVSVVSYDADTKSLTVLQDGRPEAYVLSDNTVIDKNGYPVTVANFPSQFPKGMKIDLVASQGDKSVQKIMVSNTYEGTIALINSTTSDLTIKTDDGQILPLKLSSSPLVELAGGQGAAVPSKLAVDDKVKVTLSSSQDRVSSVQQVKTKLVRLVFKDEPNRQIKVIDESGATSTFIVNYDVPIINSSKTNAVFADMSIDENMHISFTGTKVTKVAMQSTLRGSVTSVDAATGKLIVQESSGTRQTIDTAGKFIVRQGNAANGSLSSLKQGDRIELNANPDGGFTATVAEKQQRTVSGYNPSSRVLTLLLRAIGDKTEYVLHQNVYVHRGDTAVIPNYLVAQEQVSIYLIDGKIIEVERQ
ncbi:S-layer homology domain-containing protein [Paenibacillus sp. MBLB4367]|uniref:S-layer homology domain-containing protein n=1 Tax=Paenibacillus sp. MBLB4367 TaxID=3384767 RepID=UPI003907F5A9